MDGVCLECGADMTYDWAACPNCGWKAPDSWEMNEEISESLRESSVFLSKNRAWVSPTVWILLAIFLLGLVLIIRSYF
jgi:hypothetical protein